jgi:hypothetical protein
MTLSRVHRALMVAVVVAISLLILTGPAQAADSQTRDMDPA